MIFDRLLDDAAVFPPGDAPLPDAVAAHLATRRRPRGRFVGPFLCPAGRVGELVETVGVPVEPLQVVVVADGRGDLLDAVDAVLADARLHLRAVETTRAEALPQPLPEGVAGAVELPIDGNLVQHLHGLQATGLVAKLRTGGLVAEAFPRETELARALVACANAGVAVKLTAGLHAAVRHRDPATGFERHGLLNALAAVAEAQDGADADAVEAVLGERDGMRLARAIGEMTFDRARRVRRTLRSVGTCSVAEPLAELVRLGLVDPDETR